MKIRNAMMWILAAALAGCGSNGTSKTASQNGTSQDVAPTTQSTSNTTTNTTATDTATTSDTNTSSGTGDELDAGHAYVRVLGENNPGFSVFELDVSSLQVWVDGQAVAVDETGVVPMNLVDDSKALLAGKFDLPAAGTQVHVRLAFDDYGAFDGPPGAGAIDARGRPIDFTVPSELFLWAHHAIIRLDLSRSLATVSCETGCGEPGEMVLLPVLEVVFWPF